MLSTIAPKGVILGGGDLDMKKIFVAIAALLVGALLVSSAAAVDSYGRECEIIDGDIVFIDQTVAVTTESNRFTCMPIEIHEHCTVTITTNNNVKIITEDGQQIRSTNGFRFEFSATAFTSGMTWNNIPHAGASPEFEEFDTTNVISIAKSVLEFVEAHFRPSISMKSYINNNGVTVTDASGNEFVMTSAGDFKVTGSDAAGDISGTVTGNGYVTIITLKCGETPAKKYGTIVFENGIKGSNGAYIITSTGSRISVFDDANGSRN